MGPGGLVLQRQFSLPSRMAGVERSGYLKTPRARLILLCFLFSSLLFAGFSEIDLVVSRLFFDRGFYLAGQGWTRLLHEGVAGFIVVSMLSVIAIYGFNRFWKRNVLEIDGMKVLYLFLVLSCGAGLIVNAALKDNFGRVRPRDIQEFGGSRQFTPAFVITSGCRRNCSFSSGDAAGAFFSLAFSLALFRRRAIVVAAVGFGVAVSFSRIAVGAHFLSDTVVSFFVMLIVADALHFYMFLRIPESVARALDAIPAKLGLALPLS
jgi:lipid A 4'-phosphatase